VFIYGMRVIALWGNVRAAGAKSDTIIPGSTPVFSLEITAAVIMYTCRFNHPVFPGSI
jgi:acyl dehydratase